MKRYVIERDLPDIGKASNDDLKGAAKTSNKAIADVGGVRWEHSYVTDNKTFCIYLADNIDAIRKHAEVSGFPANKIYEVHKIIDPTTAN